MNEVVLLRELRHPNIIPLFEVYEDERQIHLVMEYLKGGELFDKLQAKGNYSEADAVRFMRSLLETIAYCHQKLILHRDLKPENIVLLYHPSLTHAEVQSPISSSSWWTLDWPSGSDWQTSKPNAAARRGMWRPRCCTKKVTDSRPTSSAAD